MEKVFYIDLEEVSTKEELQDLLTEILPLPDYYGRNLDALCDVFTERGEGWNIIFYNTGIAQKRLGKYFDVLQRLCREVSEDVHDLKIRFYL